MLRVMATDAGNSFSDRLAEAIDKCGSPACVGLDPVVERLPGSVKAGGDAGAALARFSRSVVDSVAGIVPAVKFQSACFERYGAAGVSVLRDGVEHARRKGLLVILDAKRGDIGVSAEHYAAAAFDGPSGADAITLSGYMGADTIEPFLRPGKGVFVLVRTSNPGSDAVQSARLSDGRTVAEMMGELVADLGRTRRGGRGLSDVGAVVGATKSGEAAALRERMPDQVFLVPGYGAQGGTLKDIRPMLRGAPGAGRPGEWGILVTASRSVIYPAGPDRGAAWPEAITDAARKFAGELRSLAG